MNTKVKQTGNTKKQAFGMPINEHVKEMDKIANDMAVLFEQKITAIQLAKWLSLANSHSDPNDDLLFHLGYETLPGLIDAKTSVGRINFLRKELPKAFCMYSFANRSLFQLGEDYFKKNKGLSYWADLIEEFLSVYLVLLAICEMFEDYEFHKEELEKETTKAA